MNHLLRVLLAVCFGFIFCLTALGMEFEKNSKPLIEDLEYEFVCQFHQTFVGADSEQYQNKP